MTPSVLLEQVRALGVSAILDGEDIRFRPGSRLSADLLSELRDNKLALCQLLEPSLYTVLGGIIEVELSLVEPDICSMPLKEFAQAGRAVAVRSEVLDEVVVVASDNATIDPAERRLIYRARELQELLPFGDESLRTIHTVKKVSGGTVLPN